MANQATERKQGKKGKSEKKGGLLDIFYGPLLAVLIGTVMFLIAMVILPHISKQPHQTAGAAQTSQSTVQTGTSGEMTSSTTTETTTTTEPYPSAATLPEEAALPAEFDESLLIARNALLLKAGAAGNTLLYERAADAKIYPASMTKIMTLVTFLELVPEEQLSEHVEMSADVLAAQRARMAYVTGFEAGERCLIRDLIYAMMLPSGADAAVMLAVYAAGSEEAFVAEMNRRAEAMGLTQTHFVNCTGLQDENHYSTAQDIARILLYAIRNPVCEQAMSTLKYTTEATDQHPNGIELVSTTLSRMVGNELEQMANPLHVIGGKTGFTNAAGQCLATWAKDGAGETYVCVVAGSTTLKPLDAAGDNLTLYQLVSEQPASVKRIQPVEADLPDYVH
ncbi:MAG: D-alanyl-D-alanine carboxypeptidase [Oscillospiraceae bacterium]|nr:D-alanyl-D-alanine carboxypeptidase [Oscillospiraceae bacterium]